MHLFYTSTEDCFIFLDVQATATTEALAELPYIPLRRILGHSSTFKRPIFL